MSNLDPFDNNGHVNAIIDTPKGSRNKFEFDEKIEMFKLGGPLPVGAVFPFDFGYVPSTKADDGDALDILILMDEPAFVGFMKLSVSSFPTMRLKERSSRFSAAPALRRRAH